MFIALLHFFALHFFAIEIASRGARRGQTWLQQIQVRDCSLTKLHTRSFRRRWVDTSLKLSPASGEDLSAARRSFSYSVVSG
jgi:hypothetical protein